MPAIRDVAEKAGVSAASVSRVLNGSPIVSEDLRQKVLAAVEAMNYQSVVGRRVAKRIAILYLCPHTRKLSSPYESACYDGIVAAMESSDYDLIITELKRDRAAGESLMQFFTRKGIAGAIVRSTRDDKAIIDELASSGFPFVLLGDHFETEDGPLTSCYSDSRTATREAISHLISLGHTEIAYASCSHSDGDHMDRLDAYREVMMENDLYREDLVHLISVHRLDGVQLARRILAGTDRSTALFVADPLPAIGVLNECYRLGVRVPEEFSVVGFDDTETRLIATPQMTAVVQDSQQHGKEAFELVVDKVEGRPIERNAGRHDCWFAIHDTTAPPPERAVRFIPRCVRGQGGVTRIETVSD